MSFGGEMTKDDHEKLQAAMQSLTDEGKIIEAGWLSLKAVWLPPDTPPHIAGSLRMAFMAGAGFLFSTILHVLEPTDEVSEADLVRMDKIKTELDAFDDEMRARLGRPTRGKLS